MWCALDADSAELSYPAQGRIEAKLVLVIAENLFLLALVHVHLTLCYKC